MAKRCIIFDVQPARAEAKPFSPTRFTCVPPFHSMHVLHLRCNAPQVVHLRCKKEAVGVKGSGQSHWGLWHCMCNPLGLQGRGSYRFKCTFGTKKMSETVKAGVLPVTLRSTPFHFFFTRGVACTTTCSSPILRLRRTVSLRCKKGDAHA